MSQNTNLEVVRSDYRVPSEIKVVIEFMHNICLVSRKAVSQTEGCPLQFQKLELFFSYHAIQIT